MTCLHGPLECKANVQQLCAAKHWSRPTSTNSTGDLDELLAEKAHGEWKTWWNFVQCMNYGKRERIGELSTAKACAKVVGKGEFYIRDQILVESRLNRFRLALQNGRRNWRNARKLVTRQKVLSYSGRATNCHGSSRFRRVVLSYSTRGRSGENDFP